MKAKNALPHVARAAVALAAGIALGVWQSRPPAADESSPSFMRMMANIERLAVEPRVVGTAGLDRARERIVAEIEDMGLAPVVHSTRQTRDGAVSAWTRLGSRNDAPVEPHERASQGTRFHRLPNEFYVHNIFVRLEAPEPGGTVMFVSHYDSWPRSPGAADAMLPIAAMLEAMRAHAGNANLANNIYFLMTDGEEHGAIGALAFIHDHPELGDRIDMIVNLEAQGNSGALILFETSPQPHSIVRAFARAAPRPLGFSVGQLVYNEMRTYTDFCFFRQYGWRGINLAIIGGVEHYHQPTDTFENLDRNTAWHYLSTVLGLADYAASNSLAGLQERRQGSVFFPFLPGNMVALSYPQARALCALAVALAAAFFFRERKAGKSRPTPLAVLLLALAAVSIAAVAFLPAASYLAWLPLLAMSATAFLKKWRVAHAIAQAASRITILLLWVPLLYLVALLV